MQLTDLVTTDNSNCELRFILNPVRREGGELYFLCEHLTNL